MRNTRQRANLRDRLRAKEGRPVDARERNNGVIIPHSLIPEGNSVHSYRDAVRVEDRDPQLRHVHSVVNLT